MSQFVNMFGGKKEIRLLTLGLDAAGKTTFLYKLKLHELCVTIPTIGFNVETVQYKNINFTIWDIGGQDRIRALWRHYFRGVDGLIYIVDSGDAERMEEAKEELHKVLNESELEVVPLLVFANKQDSPKALTVAEVTDRMNLSSVKNRRWKVQAASMLTGDGLYDGMDWFAQAVKEHTKSRK